MRKREVKYAFVKTIPILFSYIFLGMAFGIVMYQAGFSFGWAVLTSIIVYSGAFQFVLVPFLAAGTSLITVALTAVAMNSRHIFYGLSFVEEFRSMGKRFPYMVFSLTDESFALNCSTEFPEDMDRKNIRFCMSLFCHIYWVCGTLFGSVMGQVIPFDFEGIDFCMTALFVTIFIDQWRTASSHVPAVIGLGTSVLFLILLGADNFILPALVLATAILIFYGKQTINKEEVLQDTADRNERNGHE
ncbi:MAG: branched-chain amino acid ABC transporter permease [Clostridia bacterium]|nr:branched-chain amino acid ABC transporter permease [Clostridia bacterium]NCC43673.1 branched-chain amino acid ABC transporter permease [Clostridia bacterium]